MSFGKFAATRDFGLEPSRLLATGLIGSSCLAAATAVLWLPGWLAIPACLLLAVSLRHDLRRHCGRRSLCHLHRGRDGWWHLRDRSGRQFTARAAASTWVTPPLIAIRFRLEGGGSRGVVVLADSAPADVRRRLRVALRYPES